MNQKSDTPILWDSYDHSSWLDPYNLTFYRKKCKKIGRDLKSSKWDVKKRQQMRIDRDFDCRTYGGRASRRRATMWRSGAIKCLTFWPSSIKRLRVNCALDENGIWGCLSSTMRDKNEKILIPIKLPLRQNCESQTHREPLNVDNIYYYFRPLRFHSSYLWYRTVVKIFISGTRN